MSLYNHNFALLLQYKNYTPQIVYSSYNLHNFLLRHPQLGEIKLQNILLKTNSAEYKV